MKRSSTVVLVLIGLLLVSCGGGRQLPDVPPFDSVSPVIAVGKAAPVQEINLGEALAELEMLPVPEGVDASIFSELKAALADALRAKVVSKLVSKPPTGEKNRVDDLFLYDFFTLIDNGFSTYLLSWSYKNVGDYNQDGEVDIFDITPIAMHFGETYAPTNVNCLLAVIDGSGNYKVDIADVTPIAMNFGVDCAGYSIRGASTFPGGIFSEIFTAGFSFAEGEGRKSFTVGLPESECRYFAVAPFDDGGELGEPSNVVELPNQPPIADLTANPTEGDAPLEVTFDASASTDPDGEIVSYEWDWESDGVYDMTSVGTEDASVRDHTYQVGTWTPRVRVTDDDGAQATDGVTITANFAENELPIADLTANPTEGDAPLEVNFDASGSYDPDGTIVRYDYDWESDGTYDLIDGSVTSSHTYNDAGEYIATVRVTDNDGATDTTTTPATIEVNEKAGRGDWWMFGREPTHNRRSPYVGPQTATLQWRYQTGDLVYSSPAISADGTIYVGSGDNYLYALTPDGTLKWRYQTESIVSSSPAIGADGTVYVGSYDNYLYALNPDGTFKWRYQTGDLVDSSPAIGADGTIYVGSWDHYLHAINPDNGSLQWQYKTGDKVFSPAIGADGTIYVGSRDNCLYALNPDGTPQWYYETEGLVDSSPAIGADGTIYVGSWDYYLHAINPDGTPRWRYQTESIVSSSPAIGADGTIYVGSWDYYLHAINPDGTPQWRYETGDAIFSSPAIGADGTVYVGSYDNYLYALNPDGTFKWRYQTESIVSSSPAIGADGTVYVGSCDNYLYAFRD